MVRFLSSLPYLCIFAPSKPNKKHLRFCKSIRFPKIYGQALDLLVLPSLTRYRAYTYSLSTS